tara:strand:+ start:237 stop:4448 length:4212 start_codon:yes stop_codon:yes gene_type:complete
MKKIILLFFCTNVLLAQTPNTISQDRLNFVPGELIVKLKDNVDTKVYYAKSGKASSDFNIGELLGIDNKIKSYEVLFHQKSIEASIINQQKMKAVYAAKAAQNPKNGYKQKEPLTLKNIFVLKISDERENISQLIEKIKDDPNVEYAEPNYIYSINDFEIASDIMYDKDLITVFKTNTTVPNDPLYSQQTNITQTNIDDVWDEYTTGDGSQVVAILDTGVDYTHPDLEANIWINEAELNGVEGFDDDGNGYVDDIRGWDFINNDNAPLDDNMHGTHVAGIVGAVGDNGIGVAGAAWNVKLMPIKVFQSNGVGNSSTIAEGVNYATVNGATIQNMSFGSYAESSTLKSALENAYASSLLIAAAGNNGICIGPGKCPDNKPSAPLYPGAYTFILGVEDGNGGYDNYDQDGPIFSGYSNFLNYEVKAPGSAIMNTVPNGGYRALTGTSMATPLVAGAMALYMQHKPDDSKELIFGNLINTSGQNVDIKAAIDVVPAPVLKVLSADIKDEINNQNNNGFWQPGETLELFPMIKNYWGPTDDVRVGIEFWEFEDTTKAEILESEIEIGSITAYANLQDLEKSLKIKLADNIANNINIQFKLSVWSGDTRDYLSMKKITITSTNATILDGYVESDLHLTTGNEYIFSQNVVVTNNSILTIDPGVVVRLAQNIVIDQGSKIYANGNKDNPIEFRPEQNASTWGGIIVNDNDISQPSEISFSKLYNSNGGIMPPSRTPSVNVNDVLIYDGSISRSSTMFSAINANGVNIIDSFVEAPLYKPGNEGAGYSGNMYYENSSGYLLSSIEVEHLWHSHIEYGYFTGGSAQNSTMLDFYCGQVSHASNEHPIFSAPNSVGVFDAPSGIYFGTGLVENIKKITSDFYNSNNARIGKLNFSTVLLTPSDAPHGHVWKVLVNGKDAQDEYDQMDPVGIGSHEFTVYFNREMDTTVNPQISYGVREPYNQKTISEQGTWSTDSKIYTVTHDVNIGAADGINRIRVQDARDLDYFEIPVEDFRFNMLVQSAGSASTGFMATDGLGEITLDWTAPSESDLDDVLGYNMYRYTANEDGTFTDPVKINESLITDITFKDYDVARDTQYFYKYKILRTSFEETDYSNAVSSQLLTAALGDSNGDSSVNVMDVVNTVDYILGNNPTPFVDYATDVNNDSSVNVLDVVGVVDMILNPTASKVATKGAGSIDYYSNIPLGDATFCWENDDLYVESEYDITGLQLAFHKNFTYSIADNLPQFEWLNYDQDSTKVTMMYSFGNLKITAGKTKILTKINSGEVTFNIDKAVVATTSGGKLNPLYESKSVLGIDAPEQGDMAKVFTIGPNPTSGILNVFYYLPEQMDKVRMTAYDIQGKSVWVKDSFKNTSGQTNTSVDISSLNNGIYFMVIDLVRSNQIQKREVKRIIIQK